MDTNNSTKLGQLLQAQPVPDRLNQRQAADYVGLTSEWLRRLRHAGNGPPHVEQGRRRYYLRADLDAWMASRRKGVKS